MGALQVENADFGRYNFDGQVVTSVVTSKSRRYNLHKANNDKGLKENEVWLDVTEVVTLTGLSKVQIHRNRKSGKFKAKEVKAKGGKDGKKYRIALSSLPDHAKKEWVKRRISEAGGKDRPGIKKNAIHDHSIYELDEADKIAYKNAPEYNRKYADKYLTLFKKLDGLKGKLAKAAIDEWNTLHDETFKTCYGSYRRVLKAYKKDGISAILGKYGKRKGSSVIDIASPAMADIYLFFKERYLQKERKNSLAKCYTDTLGFALELGFEEQINANHFPCAQTFARKVLKDSGPAGVCLAREGEQAYNRKYAPYANRDYSEIVVGKVWVSDHCQLDVLVKTPSGGLRRPWATVWRDFKTGKWLSWWIHFEDPNTDHVIEAFCMAVETTGLPEDIIIDNGKDYRAKDFAGGRRKFKPKYAIEGTDEFKYLREQSRSLTTLLDVAVHFSKPYNAQTKPIERDYRIFHDWFDKDLPGYVGKDHKSRPEHVKATMTLEDVENMFEFWVEGIFHKMKSNGKVLSGRSREEAWNDEYKASGMLWVSEDALALYRSRVSRDHTIKRNGIYIRELKDSYYGTWMEGMEGQKVYLRRKKSEWQKAWVFDSLTNESLGTAILGYWDTKALAKTNLEHEEVRGVERMKKQRKKHLKKLNETGMDIPEGEIMRYRSQGLGAGVSAAIAKKKNVENAPKAKIYIKTELDEAASKERLKKTGTGDFGAFLQKDQPKKHKKISFLKTDMDD